MMRGLAVNFWPAFRRYLRAVAEAAEAAGAEQVPESTIDAAKVAFADDVLKAVEQAKDELPRRRLRPVKAELRARERARKRR